MTEFPTYEQMAKDIAEKALDEFLYNGKSIREWMQIIASEDIISRQAVLNEILALWNSNGDKDYCMETLRDFVAELSSVTPQQKINHWIEHKYNGMEYIECPKCLSWFLRMHLTRNSYCPNCGAKMQAKSNIKQGLNYADADTLMPAT